MGRVLTALLLAVVACAPGTSSTAPLSGQVEPALSALPLPFHRGMNLEPIGGFGGRFDLDALPANLVTLRTLGVDHVALIPSFFQVRLGDTTFVWRGGREEVDRVTREAIAIVHAAGMKVLLKPHLWLEDRSDGAWRGDILPSDAEWPAWRESYREALLSYARLAREADVAALSVGSELTGVALARPDFWRELLGDLRAEFPGTLTYAANWDRELEEIVWWDAVDAVGVDAFWPLLGSADEVPRVAVLESRLGAIRDRIAAVSARFDRPVLLTEIGYKSAVGAAYRPWEWHEGDRHRSDPEGQRAIYEAIARSFGPAAEAGWLTGLYVWVWYLDESWGGVDNSDFTPRAKPSADVLASWFNAAASGPRTPPSE